MRLFIKGAFALAFLSALAAQGITRVPAGKAIFEGKGGCRNCHSIASRGGSLGPDLTEIGVKRTAESIRLSIIDPNAEIDREYFTVLVTTKQGQRIEGIGNDLVVEQTRGMCGKDGQMVPVGVGQPTVRFSWITVGAPSI